MFSCLFFLDISSPQINNPDMRVQILKDFVKANFPSTQLLDYALDVEKITTSKVRFVISSSPLNNYLYTLFKLHYLIFSLSVVLETQPDLECGRLHWCCICGLAQDVWWFYKVSSQYIYIYIYWPSYILDDLKVQVCFVHRPN